MLSANYNLVKMKYSEVKDLSVEGLNDKLKEETETLRRLEFAHAITPLENPASIKDSRKNIAKIKTAINSKK